MRSTPGVSGVYIPYLKAGFKYPGPAPSPSPEDERGEQGPHLLSAAPFLAALVVRAECTVAPVETEACLGDLWESGSDLTVPWHGPETPLRM